MLGWRFVMFRMVISIALPPIAALLAALWVGHY